MTIQYIGNQSIKFEVPPYIANSGTVVGVKEGEGPLASLFDKVGEDDLFGENTWEAAESSMQKQACAIALQKSNLTAPDIRFLFGGDLLRQGIATSMGAAEQFQIPLFGLYGACSTSGEALALGAMSVAGGFAEQVIAVTSSHFGSAEKEFRFPLGYANQRPLSAQWTVTGSGAFVIGEHRYTGQGDVSVSGSQKTLSQKQMKSNVKITEITVGKIVDYGLKDSQNMGACMAPAARDTIINNLLDTNRTLEDYDKVITGDLGYIGSTILCDLMRKEGYQLQEKHLDCGKLVYDQKTQDTHAGGSGCGCAAVTLSSYVLPRVQSGEWERILFVPTGAMMSTVSYNEGESVPGIAHGIVIEYEV